VAEPDESRPPATAHRLTDNVEAIARLFPQVVTEVLDETGQPSPAIDFDLLRQELSGALVEGPRERYRLDWPGKRAAALSASAPPTTRLREVADESLHAASTRNAFIEGDNLEALKLLRGTHAGTVKLIYIDPPYNTRNDFVYHDDFAVTRRAFRGRDAVALNVSDLDADEHADDEDHPLPDAGGHLHSAWLSMMYPRLLLARDLLADDGVGFVSIDGNELAQLKLLLAEVFGSRNVLATIVWVSNLKGRQISGGGPAGTHEYILCFARNADAVARFRGSASDLHALMPAIYRHPGYAVKHDAKGPYVTKNELYNTNSRFNERTAPTMVYRIHYHPGTGEVRVTDIDDETRFDGFLTALPHANHRPGLQWHAWRWSRARVLADHDELEFDATGPTLRIRTKVRDVDGMTLKDVVLGPGTMSGQRDLDDLGMHRLFDAPKPVALLRTLIAVTTSDDDLVLDFFAGSGTTAQAVMEQNADDGARRRFILVQLDEPVPAHSEAAAAGHATIADVTAERMRRAAERLSSRAGDGVGDTGFRAFRLEPVREASIQHAPTSLQDACSTLTGCADDPERHPGAPPSRSPLLP
jgi:adenine-specific DNA-methyltransferase